MAAYIDRDYLIARLPGALIVKLWPDDASLTAAIEDASDHVKSMVRMHVRNGSAELGETTTDTTVKKAAYAALLEDAAAKPGTSFKLPDNWETTTYRKSLDKIEAGKLQVSEEADPAIADAVSWSDPDDYPQRTSRENLSGLG